MTRRSGLLALLLALVSAAAPGARAETPEAPALRLLLPGSLVDAAVGGEDERAVLAVVVRVAAGDASPAEAPRRRIYTYDPARRTLVPRGGWLPGGSPLLASSASGGLWVGLTRLGAVEVLPVGQGPEPGGVAGVSLLELPRRAERVSWGLRLTSPAIQALPDPAGAPSDPPCFATAPEAHGWRLRVLLLCPGHAPEELWALLPGAETVTASRFGLVDGTPALAVLTREKLGLFVKQDLRVFPLAGSRSRMGARPVLAARTDCPLWRGSEIAFADADGDGEGDLVVLCRTGLVDQELRAEVYRHRPADAGRGPFDTRARVTRIEGDFGSWHYGADWSGDGVPDLLVMRDGMLELYAGAARGRPFAARATRTLALPAVEEDDEDGTEVEVRAGTGGGGVRVWRGGPEIVAAGDLDGDGRPEIAIHRARRSGDEIFLLTP